MFYKDFYTQIFVLGMLPKLFSNVGYSLVVVVFLTCNPLFDANIPNDRYQA